MAQTDYQKLMEEVHNSRRPKKINFNGKGGQRPMLTPQEFEEIALKEAEKFF
jgi:hypothetical protein